MEPANGKHTSYISSIYLLDEYLLPPGVEGLWVQEARTVVILVLRECIWNAPTVSLFFPAFDDNDSPDYPPRRVIYRPSVSTLETASSFLAGNGKVELKPTTLSSLLVFLSFLYLIHSPDTQQTSEVVHLYSPNPRPLRISLTTIRKNRHQQ